MEAAIPPPIPPLPETSLPAPSPAPPAAEAPSARTELLARLRERIFAFAASRIGREGAEDLAQEVLLVIHEKYGHLEALEELLPLSFQILRFKLAGRWRKEARRGERSQADVEELPLASEGPDPQAQAERAELLERLAAGLKELGPRCRELFRLKLQGRAFAEIQAAMGAETLNTVYTWDHRCRKQLLAKLGGRWAP